MKNIIAQQARDNELLQLALLNHYFYHGNWADYKAERKAVHNKYRGL
jgi:hypothetical protein